MLESPDWMVEAWAYLTWLQSLEEGKGRKDKRRKRR